MKQPQINYVDGLLMVERENKTHDFSYFLTKEKVYLKSNKELKKKSEMQRRVLATDFAILNGASCDIFGREDCKKVTEYYTSDALMMCASTQVYYVDFIGEIKMTYHHDTGCCVRPAFQICLKNISKNENFDFSQLLSVDSEGHHLINIGEYPKTIVEDDQQEKLEKLYNNGKLHEDIRCSGRLFTTNALCDEDFISKKNPEFIYDGERFVRCILPKTLPNSLQGDLTQKYAGTPVWLKVEPIAFVIENWNKKWNFDPASKKFWAAQTLDLQTRDGVLAGIPFYPQITRDSVEFASLLNVNFGDVREIDKEFENNSDLFQNSLVRAFLNSCSSDHLDINQDFAARLKWNFSESGFLFEALNLQRHPTKEFVVPENEKQIAPYGFAGCIGLEKIVIHDKVSFIGENPFDGINFKWAYRDATTKNLVLATNLPENVDEISQVADIDKLRKHISGFDINLLLNGVNLDAIRKLSDKLEKSNFVLPSYFLQDLQTAFMLDEFVDNSNFVFLRNELPNFNKLFDNQNSEEKLDFVRFAYMFGCFSNEKLKDKSGKETDAVFGQKASSVLRQLLQKNILKIGEFQNLVVMFPNAVKPNQEFLKFVAPQDKNVFNINLLLKLDGACPGIFVKTMTNFKGAKQFRTTLDQNGKPTKVDWVAALNKFYYSNDFAGVTEENMDIAKIFSSKGLKQEVFDETIKFRKKAKQQDIPAHLLGEAIKEKTILESINEIKNSVDGLLQNGKGMIDDLYSKQFSYEMLDKFDPHNSIIGLYCSCCATITSTLYGKDVAISSMIAPDVQNLVVRDTYGEIVGKGTMYVNFKLGYAVLNDFEIDSKFKKHEIKPGIYDVLNDCSEEKERDLIFAALMRGVHDFVKRYDAKYPENPLQQVNVGMGANRLKKQCAEFEKATKLLTVPVEYGFYDASKEQVVLYDRNKELNKNANRNLNKILNKKLNKDLKRKINKEKSNLEKEL